MERVIRCDELTKSYGRARGVEDLGLEVRKVTFAIAVTRFLRRDVV